MPGDDPDPLLDQLRRTGVGLDEIDALVMSHFHVDHTGGIRYFADGRPVYVQGAELDFGLSPAAEPAQCLPHYDDPKIAWQRVDGDTELVDGVRAIFSPGHAPGHQSFLFELPESGKHLLAFDAVPMMENVEKDAPIAVASIPEQKPLIRESHDRVVALARSEGARLLPATARGRGPRIWRRSSSRSSVERYSSGVGSNAPRAAASSSRSHGRSHMTGKYQSSGFTCSYRRRIRSTAEGS